MLLTEEFRVRLADSSHSSLLRRPINLGTWAFEPQPIARGHGGGGSGQGDCRICAVAGDLWFRLAGGEGQDFVGQIGGFSHESEHDLAVMVSDFLENGSGGAESWCSSDSDSGFPDLNHLAEKISFYKHSVDKYESDMLSTVHSLLLSLDETELHLDKDGPCNGSCIRQSLVKHLRLSGYDAAVCISKWQGLGKVPGGVHEYIDVVNDGTDGSERLIIDIDFRSHFEIARAVESYDAILNSLPLVYVGPWAKLKQFLQVMAEATKCSLKQNSMPLPPWRTLSYLQSKWHSKYERIPNAGSRDSQSNSSSDHMQCFGHLRQLKASLQSEIERERLLKPIANDINRRRAKTERRRHSLLKA